MNSEQIWGYFLSKFEYTCIQLYSAVSRCIQMYSMCIQQPSRIHRIHAEYNHPLRIRNQPFIQMSSIPRIPCVLNVLYSTCVFCMYSECIHQYGFTTEYNRIPPHYYVVFYRTLTRRLHDRYSPPSAEPILVRALSDHLADHRSR